MRWFVFGALCCLVGCNVNTTGSFGIDDSSTEAGTSTSSDVTSVGTMSTTSTTEGTTTTTTTMSTTEGTSTTETTGSTSTTEGSTTDPGTSSTGGTTGTGGTTTGGVLDCTPLVFQVVMRAQGSDNNAEWIQIVNPCDDAVDLGDYSVGWGASNYTAGALDLAGNLASGDCYVLGGPNSDGNNGNPTIDQGVDLNPNLGNADYGVGLFDVAAGSIMAGTLPVDSVIYGVANAGLLDPDGNTPNPYVAAAGSGNSIQRVDEGTNWAIAGVDPSACAMF